MLSVQEAEIARTKARENLEISKTGSGDPSSLVGQGAFDDMTDLQNDEFIVSLFSYQEISIETDTSYWSMFTSTLVLFYYIAGECTWYSSGCFISSEYLIREQ